jgi:hypothetical protein
MSASIQYKEFVITPYPEGGSFHCKIVREGGGPFALGRRIKHEAETIHFATEAEAIHNAKLIVSLATTQK